MSCRSSGTNSPLPAKHGPRNTPIVTGGIDHAVARGMQQPRFRFLWNASQGPRFISSQESVAQNQCEKRKRDHDHPNCIEAVPAPSLFLPVRWKLLGIPRFHLIVDRHRSNETENNDGDPEEGCAQK